jgi:hypothetical protein
MTFDPPEIAWPDQQRGGMRFAEALKVSEALTDDVGLAYIHAALVSEQELGAGRGGSHLYGAAQGFMTALNLIALTP